MNEPLRIPKRPPPAVHLGVRVRPDLLARIKSEAKRQGVSLTQAVVFALEAKFPAQVRR